MKKGFTLIEVIAVIVIMGVILALTLPNIVNQISNKEEDISEASRKLIYTAADLYINDNINNYPSCIKLETLVNGGYLEKPFKDAWTKKSIPLDKGVKVTFNEYNEFTYELVEKCQ